MVISILLVNAVALRALNETVYGTLMVSVPGAKTTDVRPGIDVVSPSHAAFAQMLSRVVRMRIATEGSGSEGLCRTMVIVPETVAIPFDPIVAQVAVLVTPTLMVLPLVGLTCVPLQKSI